CPVGARARQHVRGKLRQLAPAIVEDRGVGLIPILVWAGVLLALAVGALLCLLKFPFKVIGKRGSHPTAPLNQTDCDLEAPTASGGQRLRRRRGDPPLVRYRGRHW